MKDETSAFPKGVGRPAQRALAAIGVTQLDQLTGFTEKELRGLHGMGPKALGLLQEALRAKGQAFRSES